MATYNKYTHEQDQFLKNNSPLMDRETLAEAFNNKFECEKTSNAIKGYCNRRGYNSPSDGRFQIGHSSWQKGLHGEEYLSHFTEENRKNIMEYCRKANCTAKIGDEFVKGGEMYVVTSLDYSKPFAYRRTPKRRVVWEMHHGEIPKGFSVIHLNGNQMDCSVENLKLIPNRYKAIMGRNKWWCKDTNMMNLKLKWCELHIAIKEAANDNE